MAKVSEKEMSVRLAVNDHQTAHSSEAVQQERRRSKFAQPTAGRENTGFSGLAQALLVERPELAQESKIPWPQAWTIKYRGHTQFIDINEFGVDPAAIDCMPAEVALAFEMLPLRTVGSKLLAAVPRFSDLPADEVGRLLGKDLQLVWADAKKLRTAIESHYGVKCTPA
jgi:hypothetical protein